MSFFTLLPNYMPNIVRMGNPVQFQPQVNLQAHLLIISTALRTSILNYQKQYVEAKKSQIEQSMQKIQNQSNTSRKQRKDSKLKQADKPKTISKTIQIEVLQQKTKSPTITNPHSLPSVSSKNSNQDNLSKIQVTPDVKKTYIAKQSKNTQKQLPKHKQQCNVPEVDLKDFAYLPLLDLQRQQIGIIRQNLMMRRVDVWRETEKGKRDRRQVRLLNN